MQMNGSAVNRYVATNFPKRTHTKGLQTMGGSRGKAQDRSYFFYQQPEYPRDCKEVHDLCTTSTASGVFLIKPDGYHKPFEVYCDNDADAGGWTVVQRRHDGSVIFQRDWIEYKVGFGFLSQEFWLGNEKLSFLTNQKEYELRIDFTYADGSSFYALYSTLRISDEFSNYRLGRLGQFSGTAICTVRNGLRQCLCNPGYVGDGVNCRSSTATDCLDVYNNGNTESGVYNIEPAGWSGSSFEVYCNMTDGGGWTVFQRRVDGTVDFELDWSDYKEGFGSPDHELWLGNEKIFRLTNQRRYQLRIDLVDADGDPYFAKYGFFRINNEANNYRLTVENYREGDAGDSMTRYHNNQDFSTRDQDNDDYSGSSAIAAWYYAGAWWWGVYYYYPYSDLNAPYRGGYIDWGTLPGRYYYNIKFTEMKVRPV
ncbi:Ficolin-2 [Holothuria leucospilota]|uniref:Ficolin-2 n=1 Tax=Holothuria leucospilota TaxID=206669 RepID=A0A9Q1BWD4_HOLLE|nr:Ficolin-2 [Holothuria leucospilota]